MLAAVSAISLAVVLHVWAAVTAARENYGRALPPLHGAYPVRPARRVRRTQTTGWLLSIVGAFQVGDHFWLNEPWLGISLAIAILIVVNGLPSVIVTVLHNHKLATSHIDN